MVWSYQCKTRCMYQWYVWPPAWSRSTIFWYHDFINMWLFCVSGCTVLKWTFLHPVDALCIVLHYYVLHNCTSPSFRPREEVPVHRHKWCYLSSANCQRGFGLVPSMMNRTEARIIGRNSGQMQTNSLLKRKHLSNSSHLETAYIRSIWRNSVSFCSLPSRRQNDQQHCLFRFLFSRLHI